MSGKKNLGKARGLNSIADPSDFRGKSGRPPRKTQEDPEISPEHTHINPDTTPNTPDSASNEAADLEELSQGPESTNSESTNSDGTNSAGSSGPQTQEAPKKRRGRPPATGNRRIRRELSVPVVVAEAVEQTGINPADLVMNAYRHHSDGVFTGAGARMAARGRKRLRVSLSDGDFDKITRLGESRNWNRSETVSVLLSLELLAAESAPAEG